MLDADVLNSNRISYETSYEITWCDRLMLWWFHHSTPDGKLGYDINSENVVCKCLNCCPGNLELKTQKYCCKKEKVYLMVCCAFYLI